MAESGKYGDLIKKARAEETQQTTEPDDQITSRPDERLVNLCVRVPESLRRHWAAEAKRSSITMTDVMIEALTQKFGLPDDQIAR